MTMHAVTKRSLSQRWDEYRPSKAALFWTCVGVIVATLVIGFGWGGWVTGSTSRAQAASAADVARGTLASAICVDRFNTAPTAAAKRVEFNAITSSYAKRQFVEAGGWATMPGQTTPDRLGAEGCVSALGT